MTHTKPSAKTIKPSSIHPSSTIKRKTKGKPQGYAIKIVQLKRPTPEAEKESRPPQTQVQAVVIISAVASNAEY